jgi:hypothetical protein
MMRKSIFIALLIAILAMGMFVVSASDDDDKKNVKTVVYAGAYGNSLNDANFRVAEYNSLGEGLEVGFKSRGLFKDGALAAYFKFVNADEMKGMLYRDFGRTFEIKVDYNRFMHRLVNDSLDNLQAVKSPKSVSRTHNAPDAEFGITYSELKAEATLRHPSVPGLTMNFGYRNETREGTKQVNSVSHCSACHITGNEADVNQIMNEVNAKINLARKGFSIGAEFQNRTFEEKGTGNSFTFMKVQHPTKGLPLFYDRVQFSELDGEMPFLKTPKMSKMKVRLFGTFDMNNAGRLNAGYVYSTVTNEDVSLDMVYNGLRGGWAKKLGKKMALRLRGSYFTIGNDDVAVDVIEPVNVKPYTGLTYAERFNLGDPDFVRKSILNRSVMQIDADWATRLAARSNLTLGYRYKKTDREDYAVSEGGDTATSVNRIKASLSSRFGKKTRFSANAVYEMTDLPLLALNQAGTPSLNSAIVPSPFVPIGLPGGSYQYQEIYNMYQIDMTNAPTNVMAVDASLTHKLGKAFSINGKFKYSTKKNDALDYYEWSKENMAFSASAWFALSKDFYGTIAYTYADATTETLFTVPVFDG